MNLLALVRERWLAALDGWVEAEPNWGDLVRRSQDPKFGDYQINGAMPVAKKLGKPPREIAERIVARLAWQDVFETPEIAGPGFINLRVKDERLAAEVLRALRDERLGVGTVARPRRYVIDYSGPNVAKPMHVGHIRSTVIGDCLARLLRFLGHDVLTDNHIGDWGTQFGMIIYGYRHFVHRAAYERSPVAELSRLYRLVRQLVDFGAGKDELPRLAATVERTRGELELIRGQVAVAPPAEAKGLAKNLRRTEGRLAEQEEELAGLRAKLARVETDPELSRLAADHPDIGRRVLEETAKLHTGDQANLALWREFLPPCRAEMETIYKRLDVKFDHTLGESHFHALLPGVVEKLVNEGIARESQGAIAVFLEDSDVPFLIRKQDGAFLYATTDLATISWRMEHWRPDAILYVVDFRQSLHFEHLFATARKLGFGGVELQHVKFGTVMGEDNKPFKTRSGDTVGLESLLDDAIASALKVVAENDDAKPSGPELDGATRQRVAETVGIGAIKYADLSQNRESDYVFSLDKMTAMRGNTATYLQYAYARLRSIFGKGEIDPQALVDSAAEVALTTPDERALVVALLGFEEALHQAAADYRPNLLANYLWELANTYSTFYERSPVLKAPTEAVKTTRLLLCEWTGRTLRKGLELLGIQVVEKM